MLTEKQVKLGYFPRPYPHELWYGVESRYIKRTQSTVFDQYIKRLYGQRISKQPLSIPINLDRFVSILPLGFSLTKEEILLNHTLLPYVIRFIPAHAGQRLILQPNKFLLRFDYDVYLKICLICAEEQKETFGEPYWDRRCQLPHVKHCTVHGIPLTITKIPTKSETTSHLPITVNTVLKDGLVYEQDHDRELDPIWYQIAKDSVWLLENSSDWLDPEGLKIQYQRVLAARGYATHNKHLYSQKLWNAWEAAYSPSFLQELSLDVAPDVERNWIKLVVNAAGRGVYKPPIQHILMLNFLQENIQDFFETSPNRDPFGVGPWPCHNPGCNHYHKNVIGSFILKYRTHDGLPIGTFECQCGYVYRRTGPDQNPDDIYKGSVVELGPVWKSSFLRDWNNQFLTTFDLCIKYERNRDFLNSQAQKLELNFPKQSFDSRFTQQVFAHCDNSSSLHSDNLQEICRHIFRVLYTVNEGNLSNFERKINLVIKWLKKNDDKWLSEFKLNSRRKLSDVDDLTLAEELKTIGTLIRDSEGRPQRVSFASIMALLGFKWANRNEMADYPHSMAIITTLEDSIESFALRRLKFFAKQFWEMNLYPTRHQLRHRANIYDKLPRDTVDNLLNQAFEYLDSLFQSNQD